MTPTVESAPRTASKTARAIDVCEPFSLTPMARMLLNPETSVPEFYRLLIEMELWADARRLLAHALPPRRSVWWASLCLHDSAGRKPLEPDETAAFAAAMKWVLEPTDGHRRAAGHAGRRAGLLTVGGQLASAAWFSGGSLTLPHLPPVWPKPYLTGRLCGVVIHRASVRAEPANYKQNLRQYLAVGEQVARGELLPPGTDPEPTAAPATPAPVIADPKYTALIDQWTRRPETPS